MRKVGEAMELRDEADEVIAGLSYRLRRVRKAALARSNAVPRVLVLEWLDPPYVAGHWVPELIEIAGGEDVAGVPRARAVARSWRGGRAPAAPLLGVARWGVVRGGGGPRGAPLPGPPRRGRARPRR